MLWLKAFHLIFMVTWFAGLFYLPRLFIYHLQASNDTEHERFCVMERKLFIIMSIGAVLTVTFGGWLLGSMPGLLATTWLQAKLLLVGLLIAYHGWCGVLVGLFRRREARHSDLWLRWFNEIPALLLIAIIILAVVRPQ
ncbi:MAG: CopD family protein [Gammaproteobacteria bacterium]|nr:CopD family protein [Gammaproteobacteria bacterium]NND59450.1 TIGR00701 family protein [Gammaproteobacteria bacterium]